MGVATFACYCTSVDIIMPMIISIKVVALLIILYCHRRDRVKDENEENRNIEVKVVPIYCHR